MIGFYGEVQDQVTNLSPMGDPFLVPRLEAWLAVADAEGIDHGVVRTARYLHELVQDRQKVPGIHLAPASSLAPPEEPS